MIKNMMSNRGIGKYERIFMIVSAVFVIGALFYMYVSSSPKTISPISGQTIFNPDFVFEIENGEELVISTSLDFTSPIILNEGSETDLPPGTYYWKVRNWLRESEVGSFTIESSVGLNLRKGNEKNLLENSGNVPVDVTKKKGGITTQIPVDVGKSLEVEKDNSSYEGRQNG